MSTAHLSTRHRLVAVAILAAAVPALAWAGEEGADLSGRLACFETQSQRLVARRDDDQRQREALISGLDALAALNVRHATAHEVLRTLPAGDIEAPPSQAYAEAVAKASAYEARRHAAQECKRTWAILAFLHCRQFDDVGLVPQPLPPPPPPPRHVQDMVAASETLARSQAALDKLKTDVAMIDAQGMSNAIALAKSQAIVAALKANPGPEDAKALTAQARTLLAEQQLDACF